MSLESEEQVSLGVVKMLAGCLDMNINVFVAGEHAARGLVIHCFEGISLCMARLMARKLCCSDIPVLHMHKRHDCSKKHMC